jgi:DNA polymerase I-like protein with 3'-5' exonuclease and polymerase domains
LNASPLVEVVDEVLFEVEEARLHETARVCAEAMKNAYLLEVPLVVGVEAGKTWADLAVVTLE